MCHIPKTVRVERHADCATSGETGDVANRQRRVSRHVAVDQHKDQRMPRSLEKIRALRRIIARIFKINAATTNVKRLPRRWIQIPPRSSAQSSTSGTPFMRICFGRERHGVKRLPDGNNEGSKAEDCMRGKTSSRCPIVTGPLGRGPGASGRTDAAEAGFCVSAFRTSAVRVLARR